MKKESVILLFIKIPPPVTGVTLLNKYVAESILLNETFKLHIIPVSFKKHLGSFRMVSFNKFIKLVKLIYKLFCSIIRYKPRLIYFQLSPIGIAFLRDCLFIFIIKLFNKNLVFHLHGKGIKASIGNSKIKKAIYKWAFNKSSIVCLSESLTYDIKDVYYGIPYIVNNGIPALKNQIVLRRAIGSQTINILFFSNLIISKGIYDYLDAIALIVKKSNQVKGYIVGDEADLTAEQLYNAIKLRNLSNLVSYLGARYDEDKYTVYFQSDVFVFPTYNDVWGLVILEAMQSGLPVIASREGAIPEIVDDGITGFLVDKHRPDQVADKIEILINNPELRKRMGEAGKKKFLEKYTTEVFELNLKNVFNDILNRAQ